MEKNLAISSKIIYTFFPIISISIFRNLFHKYTCKNTIVACVVDYPDVLFMTKAMGDTILTSLAAEYSQLKFSLRVAFC